MKPAWLVALVLAAVWPGGSLSSGEPSTQDGGRTLAESVSSLTVAMLADDETAIAHWLAEDWTLVEGNGRTVDRARVLEAVRSGDLVHDAMTFDEIQSRGIGNLMLWSARARGGGRYRGDGFAFDERSSSLWARREGRWVCLFTQLTPISQPSTH